MPMVPFATAFADILGAVGELVAGAGRRFDVPLLVAGLGLHLLADVVRNGGWHTVLRAASPAHRALRLRDVQAAVFVGGGVNAIVPARAGDVVKVALVRRRLPEARVPTVMATFLPETLFEWIAGAALLVWALSAGYLPADAIAQAPAAAAGHALVTLAVAVGLVAAVVAAGVLARRMAHRLYRDVAAGFAILRRPRRFVTGVVSFQLASRVIRLGAIACCLSACRLPGDAAAAALVMAVEGGTRVRFGPATAALRAGLLAYGLPLAGGSAASLSAVLAYMAVVHALRTAVALIIAAAVVATTLGARSPRAALDALRLLREPAVEPLPPEAPQGVTAR
jgi:lysylphosphatidylglycerol synthase-like protein